MSKNVNVLAVMDDYPDLLDFAAIHYGAWASDCKGAYIASPHVIESLARARKARAAVADLIAKAEVCVAGGYNYHTFLDLSGALARVKGESA